MLKVNGLLGKNSLTHLSSHQRNVISFSITSSHLSSREHIVIGFPITFGHPPSNQRNVIGFPIISSHLSSHERNVIGFPITSSHLPSRKRNVIDFPITLVLHLLARARTAQQTPPKRSFLSCSLEELICSSVHLFSVSVHPRPAPAHISSSSAA